MKKFFAIIFFCINFYNTLLGQIIIEDNFEMANIELISINIDSNYIKFRPKLRDNNISRIWFYFKIKNFAPKLPLKIELANTRPEKIPTYPVYSSDMINWERVTKHKMLYTGMLYTVTAKSDSLYFAMGYPYGRDNLAKFTRKIQNHKHCTIKNLCISKNNNPVILYEIENKKYHAENYIFIICRQHAFESLSNYLLEGFIEYLLSQNKYSKYLLEKFCFYIVPIVDIDNVINGNSGRMQTPVDYNRDWGKNSKLIEIQSLKQLSDSLNLNKQLSIFFDIHSTFPGAYKPIFSYFDIYNDSIYSKNMKNYWRYFTEYQKFTPICLDYYPVCTNCADYYFTDTLKYKNADFSLTLEIDWNYRFDSTFWTPKNLRTTGNNMLKALYDYYYKQETKNN